MVLSVQYTPRSLTCVLGATGYTGSKAWNQLICRSALYGGTLSVTGTRLLRLRPLLPFCPASVRLRGFNYFICSRRGRWLLQESPSIWRLDQRPSRRSRVRVERCIQSCVLQITIHDVSTNSLSGNVHTHGTPYGNQYLFCTVSGNDGNIEKKGLTRNSCQGCRRVYMAPE